MNPQRFRRTKFQSQDEIISPLYDFAFAQIFGNQKNINITKAFLKTLLDIPEDDYDKLTIVSPFLKRFFQRDKLGVVDLKLSTKSGRIIHIELQVNKRSNFRSRVLYYAARLLGDQLQWGDDYDKLHQVISIVICDHDLLEEEESYINVYELRNRENRRFTNLLKVVILELPKIPKKDDSPVWPWLRFFTCERKEEFEMLARKHPELEEAVFCAKKMSLMEKWRDIRFHENLRKVDERMLLKQAQIDGHKEGHIEGLAEGSENEKLVIARKLKGRGRPVEEIAEDTGLSVDVVEKL